MKWEDPGLVKVEVVLGNFRKPLPLRDGIRHFVYFDWIDDKYCPWAGYSGATFKEKP